MKTMPPGHQRRSEMNGFLSHRIREFWAVKDNGTGDFADKYNQHDEDEKLGDFGGGPVASFGNELHYAFSCFSSLRDDCFRIN